MHFLLKFCKRPLGKLGWFIQPRVIMGHPLKSNKIEKFIFHLTKFKPNNQLIKTALILQSHQILKAKKNNNRQIFVHARYLNDVTHNLHTLIDKCIQMNTGTITASVRVCQGSMVGEIDMMTLPSSGGTVRLNLPSMPSARCCCKH